MTATAQDVKIKIYSLYSLYSIYIYIYLYITVYIITIYIYCKHLSKSIKHIRAVTIYRSDRMKFLVSERFQSGSCQSARLRALFRFGLSLRRCDSLSNTNSNLHLRQTLDKCSDKRLACGCALVCVTCITCVSVFFHVLLFTEYDSTMINYSVVTCGNYRALQCRNNTV